ncbi:response regulator transcription factor [Dyella dinghuensis]|uniref:Response regulator transcription factor n=1 Tax=Dyella dinghuensis TaxID=1920169 RepID=A0A432LWZ5_9GAMM|nr:response regulator [Dyella dinghuensis]RUL65872.1 response regulator transcription factor [Dyella dinghuensis]
MNSVNVSDRESESFSLSNHSPVVFVVDQDRSVRESLEALIEFQGWHAETFSSAHDFLARPRDLVPSCLVLDLSLPDVSGLDVQKRVAADRVDMPVIFITGCGDVAMTVQAMKAGATEFLTKPFDSRVLLEAIKQAIDQSRAALEHEAALQELFTRYELLSTREREVMALVVTGLLNKQIGSELGISEITVKAHRGRVMRKMRASSLPDLVNLVTRLHHDPSNSNLVSPRVEPVSHVPIATTPKHNCASL